MMAHRVDHNRAMIPPPSREMLTKMARAGYDTAMEYKLDSTTPKPFSDCGDDVRGVWHSIAQTMYSVIAIEGGAGKIKLAEH